MIEAIKNAFPEFKVMEGEEREIVLRKGNNKAVLGYSFTPRGKIYLYVKEVNGEKVKRRGTRGTFPSLSPFSVRRCISYMLKNAGFHAF